MTSYQTERTAVRDAARLAGKLCLAIRDEMLHEMGSMEKAGHEPVTVADYGAQAIVMQHLSSVFPQDGSLAEEKGSDFSRLTSDDQQLTITRHVGTLLDRTVTADDIKSWLDAGRETDSRRRWVIDPIDGTKGFIRGDQFAVAVALLVDGEPVVGALACPLLPFGYNGAAEARGIVATAVKGQGATIEPLLSDGPVISMQVSDRTDAASARIVESVETGHTDHSVSSAILKTAGVGGQPVRMDSQAKYAAVADGRAEIYLRMQKDGYRERIWDHAAGALIVQEAGGIVTDLDGKPLDFSLGQTLEQNRGILATGSQPIHDAMLAAIRQHVK